MDVTGIFSISAKRRARRVTLRTAVLLGLCALMASVVAAQSQSAAATAEAPNPASPANTLPGAMGATRPILLVLPFDNQTDPASVMPGTTASGTPQGSAQQAETGGPTVSQASELVNLDWIREAAPAILDRRLSAVGYLPLTREDRLYALDHLGLPESFQPSRATALRLAETLDAEYIVIGSFAAQGTHLKLTARLIDVTHLRMSGELVESGEIAQLLPLLNSLAWQLARKLEPNLDVSRQTFVAASAGVRLDAFEQYIRGITERDRDERLRHLKRATALSPDLIEAWMALGKEEFEQQDYEDAAVAFARVPPGDASALESDFYRGLSLIYSGNYQQAGDAFASIARVLPLPEVVNNQGVAASRRGQDGAALYRQAEASDPTNEDYHFNLAVSLHRSGDKAGAKRELDQALKLRGADSEARALLASWTANSTGPATDATPATAVEPLERIQRNFNGAAFRQAALMLDQVEAARIATLPGDQRAAKLSRDAQEKLNHGLLLEAEREYRTALAADPRSADAHAGMAEVEERAGDPDNARKHAQQALAEQPNLEACLVLARLDLAADQIAAARADIAQALRLDGANRSARDLRKTIEARAETMRQKSLDAPPVGAATNTTEQPPNQR